MTLEEYPSSDEWIRRMFIDHAEPFIAVLEEKVEEGSTGGRSYSKYS